MPVLITQNEIQITCFNQTQEFYSVTLRYNKENQQIAKFQELELLFLFKN